MTDKKVRQADDLLRLKFLQDAQISPDGKTLAYVVTHIAPKEEDALLEWMNRYVLDIEPAQTEKITE